MSCTAHKLGLTPNLSRRASHTLDHGWVEVNGRGNPEVVEGHLEADFAADLGELLAAERFDEFDVGVCWCSDVEPEVYVAGNGVDALWRRVDYGDRCPSASSGDFAFCDEAIGFNLILSVSKDRGADAETQQSF
jgi:hypothetical protein